ncbi:conserved hypothetical protein [Ricinus communis]|uniref:MaoC-like domain-containing protein n=1 Tax=Ricinus communis TaxID=3988 RepID=B9T9E6_RICCO|nr:conserved hypothetical protein [Ricinus communis]
MVAVNDRSPGGCLFVSTRLAALHLAGGRDFLEGHYDLDATRALGHPHIYMSTYFHQGLVDRAVTDWLGPNIFIARRKAKTVAPIYVGDTVRWDATVMAKDERMDSATLKIELTTQRGLCCIAETTILWSMRKITVQ